MFRTVLPEVCRAGSTVRVGLCFCKLFPPRPFQGRQGFSSALLKPWLHCSVTSRFISCSYLARDGFSSLLSRSFQTAIPPMEPGFHPRDPRPAPTFRQTVSRPADRWREADSAASETASPPFLLCLFLFCFRRRRLGALASSPGQYRLRLRLQGTGQSSKDSSKSNCRVSDWGVDMSRADVKKRPTAIRGCLRFDNSLSERDCLASEPLPGCKFIPTHPGIVSTECVLPVRTPLGDFFDPILLCP